MSPAEFLRSPWFFVLFGAMWLGAVAALAWASGWRALAERFRSARPVDGSAFGLSRVGSERPRGRFSIEEHCSSRSVAKDSCCRCSSRFGLAARRCSFHGQRSNPSRRRRRGSSTVRSFACAACRRSSGSAVGPGNAWPRSMRCRPAVAAVRQNRRRLRGGGQEIARRRDKVTEKIEKASPMPAFICTDCGRQYPAPLRRTMRVDISRQRCPWNLRLPPNCVPKCSPRAGC